MSHFYFQSTTDMISYFMKGRQALQELERTVDLEKKNTLRGYIVESIVSYAYEKRLKFSRGQIQRFALDIADIFLSEDSRLYYLPPLPSEMQADMTLKKFSPKGKLYDAYNNSIKTDIFEQPQKENNNGSEEQEIEIIDDNQQPRSKNTLYRIIYF